MVKVTVFSFKNLIKYIRFLFFVLILLACLYWIYNNTKNNVDMDYIAHNVDTELDSVSLKILNENIPTLKLFATRDDSEYHSPNIIEHVLYAELPIINSSFLVSSITNNTSNSSTTQSSPEPASLTYAADNVQT